MDKSISWICFRNLEDANDMRIIYRDIIKQWAACWQEAILAGFLFVVISRKCSKELNKHKFTYILFFFDGVFLYYLLYVTLLSRSIGSRREVSLLPFMGEELSRGDFHYVIENILLFVPFGILLYITLCIYEKRCNIKTILLISFLTSMSVEWLQYIFACGKTEMDDIITNILGAVLGYLIIKLKRV